jgi:hypothetical protein
MYNNVEIDVRAFEYFCLILSSLIVARGVARIQTLGRAN